MTDIAATRASGVSAPWHREDHWREGDAAITLSFHGYEEFEEAVTIVSPADRTVGYWSQWPAEARAQYNELRQHICWNSDGRRPTGTFADEANVPEWFRAITAGLLRPPEAPTLQVARIWDPVDWPTLLENNPRRPAVSIGPDGYGPMDLTWQMVADAYRILDAAGKTPSLDIDIEINADSELALAPTVLYCGALSPDLDRNLIARVDASLGGQTPYNTDDGGWMWA